ncbi:thiol-disulfide oxidoreductase DCC family protein [Paenibacillus pini]|uniref:YuxK protein n=1 Tax=Paenibacillus pini JCM 16418 TaxID=1236976 RepID=W7Z1F9_9BACL|nr:thiol-disulfide oxidoreductase DCC family protein [Paenibacillus pini]GAF08199.1 hypothetical protein JCM16418_2240 [Paenibacillus pini JCM 16418]
MNNNLNPVQGPSGQSIVLMDGVCNLCQGLTQFIIRRDTSGYFKFASLQSDMGQSLLKQGGLQADVLDTFVLIEDGQYYTRSTAALRMVKHLNKPWPILYGLVIIPRFLRNGIYRWVSRNRYRWFGKEDKCMLPTPEIRDRFL